MSCQRIRERPTQAIEQRRAECFNAIDEGNIPLLMSLVGNDAELVFSGKLPAADSRQIAHCLKKLFESFNLQSNYYDINFQKSDGFFVESGNFYCTLVSKPGQRISHKGGSYTVFWRLEESDSWKIARLTISFD